MSDMIVIRADGNGKIGVGHLMRCLTIADALQRRQCLPGSRRAEILFACADEESARLAAGRGYETLVLGTDYRMMETELPFWREWRENSAESVVFLADSYFVTDIYLSELGKLGKVILLDDMAEHPFPVHTVVNYNAFATAQQYEELYAKALCGGKQVRCLTGSSYVPIRRQFIERGYSVRESADRILITTGGGDSDNIAARILDAVYEAGREYHVVIGRFHPAFDSWLEREKKQPGIRVHYDVSDMAGLMSQCDMAITAGGTTIYELAAMGVPFLCFSYAVNQEKLTEYIDRQKIAGYGGAYHREPERTLEQTAQVYRSFTENASLRREYAAREKKMTDGLGADRLAEILNGMQQDV